MQRLSAWARGIASVIFTGVVLPLVVYFIEQQPPETAGSVLRFFLNLAEQTWLRVTALLLVGFVAGLWLEWLLRQFDGSRAEARKSLGEEMQSLCFDINQDMGLGVIQSHVWPQRLHRIRARLMYISNQDNNFDLWVSTFLL